MAEKSYEEQLYEKIQTGNINDKEISDVLGSGDRRLLRTLNEREQHLRKEKEHLERMYGPRAWDGRDNQGRLFKDIPLHDAL